MVALKPPKTIKNTFGTRDHHCLELGVEHFFKENSLIPVEAYVETREITQSERHAQSEDLLVERCDLSNRRNKSVDDGHRHFFRMHL